MDNYIVIEGKRIELSDELVSHIREQLHEGKYLSFVNDASNFDTKQMTMDEFCEIGKNAVPSKLVGRCMVLYDNYKWDIIDNPSTSNLWTKLLVATKK